MTGAGGGRLLEVEGLTVSFPTPDGVVEAVRGVDLGLDAGRVLGVVGESGAGKSVTMMAAMGLLPASARVAGSIRIRGREVVGTDRAQLTRMRGSAVGMIFQDPMTSLNPVLTVGAQVAEAVWAHDRSLSRSGRRLRAVELLEMVGVPDAGARAGAYPHQLSGGLRQRVMTAMAMANRPPLLIADEPTSALDVTVQAQVLDLLRRLCAENGMGLVLVTHDLGVVAGLAHEVVVMYAGQVVERAPVDELFQRPMHPYTRGLLASLPRPDLDRPVPLTPIPGAPPDMAAPPGGCAFHPRCPAARARCAAEAPALRPVGGGHSRCHYSEELAGGVGAVGASGAGPAR